MSKKRQPPISKNIWVHPITFELLQIFKINDKTPNNILEDYKKHMSPDKIQIHNQILKEMNNRHNRNRFNNALRVTTQEGNHLKI